MLDLKNRNGPYIIAEAGTNHASRFPEERLPKALQYVRAAAEAKADAIKFQMFANPIQPPDMFCWIDGDEERSARWALSELPLDEWRIVKQEAEAFGMDFLASVFQHTTVGWLRDLDVVATKVASRAARDFPYRDAPAPWLTSTGMHLLPDDVMGDTRAFKIECESVYPSKYHWCGHYPGFSDHSGTPDRAIGALRRGCKLIEVHFMIDPADAGPDLPASLTLDQLALITHERDLIATP